MFFPYFLTITGFIASNCPQGTQPSLSNPNLCYYFGTQPLQYMNAEEQCQILNGHLTKIHNIQEDIFLSQSAGLNFTNASVKDFWFGTNKMTGKWEWLDGGGYLNFTFWNISEPSNQKEQICGAVSTEDGKWSAQDCFKFKPYICEIFVKETKPSTRTTTIVSSTSPSSDQPGTCSNELTTTCGPGLPKRVEHVCGGKMMDNKVKTNYMRCTMQRLKRMCCENQCSNCDIKDCRCPGPD